MSLLSFAASEKSIDCKISNDEWSNFNREFRTCNVYNQAIDSLGFTIATPTDSTLEGFVFQDNPKVELLPGNLSEKFPNLIAVQIFNCSIKSIDENHFKGLHSMTLLNLAFNKIERIDSNAFKDNVKLEQLTLKRNNIKYLSDDLFNSLRSLKQLFLNDNQIRFIDPFLFKHTTSLERIDMDNNEVKFLHPETFSTLSNLKNISISDNQLESIDGKLLANNKKLEHIWFESNKLRSIDATMFDDKENLTYVDFEGNSCIDGFFFSTRFTEMKTKIKEKCLSFESLQLELKSATSNLSQLVFIEALFEKKINDLIAEVTQKQTEIIGLKVESRSTDMKLDEINKELNKCKKIQGDSSDFWSLACKH
jgi:hypothetical protein